MLYLIGIFSGLTALSITFPLWLENPVGLPCQTVSHDGTLAFGYSFDRKTVSFLGDGDSLLLAGGTGHNHGTFSMESFDGLPSGSRVHLEYCGPTIVRLSADGREVYKHTQKNAEDNRLAGMRQTGLFAIFAFLAAILGCLLAWLAPDA